MSRGVSDAAGVESPAEVALLPVRTSFYYGWVMLPLSMAALVASSPGQTFGVSIFNEPMRRSLGLSQSSLALAYTLGTLLGAMPISYIGKLMDRHGLRRMMLVAIGCFCLACCAVAAAQNWLMMAAGFFLLRMLGPGTLTLLSSNTLPFWFERRLGMVEGLRQLGMAVAMTCIPTLNLWLVDQWGWRGAYVILGTVIAAVLIPVFLVWFRNHPEEVGQQIDGGQAQPMAESAADTTTDNTADKAANWQWGLTLNEALRTPAFWIVGGGTALLGLVCTALFFCLVPIFQERGLSETDAAMTLTVYAICWAMVQPLGGWLADRIRAEGQMAAGMVSLAAATGLLHLTTTPLHAMLGGAVLGVAQGIYFGAVHPLWPRYFGRLHLGQIRGVLMTIGVAFSALGPLLAGLAFDYFGSFSVAMIAFSFAPLPFAIASLWASPPPRPVR